MLALIRKKLRSNVVKSIVCEPDGDKNCDEQEKEYEMAIDDS